jgi:glutaredoxin 3
MVGPITVFTVENCPYCKQVKSILEDRKLPFTDISLSKFPQKRKDLLQLTGKVSVPQLFIHNEWIGDVNDALSYIRDFDRHIDIQGTSEASTDCLETPLDRLERQVGRPSNSSHNVNPRFMIPIMEEHEVDETECRDNDCEGGNDGNIHNPAKPIGPLGSSSLWTSSTAGTNRTHSRCCVGTSDDIRIETPNGTVMTVLEITELLKQILRYGNRRWNFTTYKNCCSAEQIVDALVEHYNCSRPQAEDFAKLLNQYDILVHVSSKNNRMFRDTPAHFFRLRCFHTPSILNSYRSWPTTCPQPHPEEALERILTIFRRVEDAIIIEHDGHINYQIAHMCTDYAAFEDAVCELIWVDLSHLVGAAMLVSQLDNDFLKWLEEIPCLMMHSLTHPTIIHIVYGIPGLCSERL